MSNVISLIPTEFVDVRNGEKSFGFRIVDNYAKTYWNMWDSVPDDDLELLKLACQALSNDEIFGGMLDYIIEHERGIDIGDVSYSWDEIQPIFQELGLL